VVTLRSTTATSSCLAESTGDHELETYLASLENGAIGASEKAPATAVINRLMSIPEETANNHRSQWIGIRGPASAVSDGGDGHGVDAGGPLRDRIVQTGEVSSLESPLQPSAGLTPRDHAFGSAGVITEGTLNLANRAIEANRYLVEKPIHDRGCDHSIGGAPGPSEPLQDSRGPRSIDADEGGGLERLNGNTGPGMSSRIHEAR
jgi:hypothetical protein